MRRSLLWGAIAGVAYALMATRPARIRVSTPAKGTAEDLLRLVEQVEREPEFIPFVKSVQVHSREGETVRYRVAVNADGLPGWAVFQKRIQVEEGRAEWITLEGIFGFNQWGRLIYEETEREPVLSVETDTRFDLPVVGPILAHLSSPVLAYAFGEWLNNLNRAVAPDNDTAPNPASTTTPAVA